MTKAKYMYELIDQCMSIFCQDNILVENFELNDQADFYEETEKQFLACLEFYDDMKGLIERKEIDEIVMDRELRSIIVLMRQKALKRLFDDIVSFLEASSIPKEEREKEIYLLSEELQDKTIDAGYLLDKIVRYRELEQSIC